MKQLIEIDLAALQYMTPRQLRERYAELHGEPSRSATAGDALCRNDRLAACWLPVGTVRRP